MEIESRALTEYTQVIINEADRLQALVDRLLAPHRKPHVVGDVNIHEVCERVRSLILAEFPRGLAIERDYDISIPEFRGDREQLIQAVLNIAHNAAAGARPSASRPAMRSIIAAHAHRAPGDARQAALSSGTGIAYRGQRPGRPRVDCAIASSSRWCRVAKAARDSGSRWRRPSCSNTMARSNAKASRAARSSRS